MKNTPTGTLRLSTPEGTALDLVLMPRRGGGLSNVATILGEMVQDAALDPVQLADLEQLLQVAGSRTTPAPLDTSGPRRGPLDERWNVIINGPVEPDL